MSIVLLRAIAFLALCTLATPALAVWSASDEYTIQILVNGVPTVIQASAIDVDDELYTVRVGDDSPVPLDGVVTVLQEQGIERRFLGNWSIVNGQGNVQATYGHGSWQIGSGVQADDLDGILDVLNSDITGAINVRHGSLRVHTGSQVQLVTVYEFGTAYIEEGTVVDSLSTETGGLTLVNDSIVGTTGNGCSWQGTLRADDSILRCATLQMQNGGVGEIGLLSLGTPEFEVAGKASVFSSDLAVQGTTVTTGEVEMRGFGASLDVNGGTWTNAGKLNYLPSLGDPDTIRLHGGADFHGQGVAYVAGNPGAEHLVVTGTGTTLELDQDLRVGEFLTLGGLTQAYTGTLTVADGATLIVGGTFQIGSQAIVNLEAGGTIYAAALDDQGGTINENGGALVVPEPDAGVASLAAIGVIVLARRGRLRR